MNNVGTPRGHQNKHTISIQIVVNLQPLEIMRWFLGGEIMKRFFVLFGIVFAYIFGATVAYACDSDEIDVLGDGTQCETAKFSVTTTPIAAGTFTFYISAKGTFYVDCGDGGTLSGTGVSGKTVARSSTGRALYTCTYSGGESRAKDIRFGGGAATGAPYVNGTNNSAAAISFYGGTPTLVESVSGSLGELFPSRGTSTSNQKPRFVETFRGCTKLTTIPSNLVSGLTTAVNYEFYRTFYGCTMLRNIPNGLFNEVTGTANLLFYQTFYNCSGLTGTIPAGMFDKITTYSINMMTEMFYNTGLTQSCSGTTVQYTTPFDSYWNGRKSCTEPFVTPIVLNGQSATTEAAPTTIYLKYATGWYFDADATVPISGLNINPTKTDYIFDGYYTAANGAGTQVIDPNGDFMTTDAMIRLFKITVANATLYANWVQNFNVTYNCGGGTGIPPESRIVSSRKVFTMVPNTCTRDGYMFYGWGVSGTQDVIDADISSWNYTEDKTFTAQWIEPKFTITTTELNANNSFSFYLSAIGTFYVDWGDGYGRRIVRSNTTDALYSHAYQNAGVYNIQIAGVATGYVSSAGNNGVGSAIRFSTGTLSSDWSTYTYGTEQNIAQISGSLGEIFPTIGTNKPVFARTFLGARNLKQIPATLFNGVSGALKSAMFDLTFAFSGITSIPETLFYGLTGGASTAFQATFRNCMELRALPQHLFNGITGGGSGMFGGTFKNCTNLTGYVPPTLFETVTVNSTNLMQNMFQNTGLLTECPPCHVQYMTGWESYWDGKVSCEVGLSSNEHWYNDICVTDCSYGGVKIMTSTGLEFPMFSNKPTSPALHIGFTGNGVCYVPLEPGIGGVNSMNVSYDGQIYHLGTLTAPVVP